MNLKERAMDLKVGVTNIELVLDNTIERDSLIGIYEGHRKFCGSNYITIRSDGPAKLSHIRESIIRAIHIL